MNRRDTVVVVLFSSQVPSQAQAQSMATPAQIGVMYTGQQANEPMKSFFAELQRQGYEEGKNLTVKYLQGEVSRFPEFANDLVRRKVDLIYASTTAAAVAARSATATIPIVFATAHDPVEVGLVQSLSKPGGNVTGITVFASELPGKRLQLLRDFVSGLTQVAVLRSPLNKENTPAWNALVLASKTLTRSGRGGKDQGLAIVI